MKKSITKILATGLGLGYLPKAPGTIGSLWGVLLFWLFRDQTWSTLALATIGITLLGILVSSWAEDVFGKKDCQMIVIDEVAGQLCAYLFVPFSLPHLVLGFLLFRLFDVLKIFPANWAQDHFKGGFGVVGDDVVAGLQAGLVLWGVSHLLIV